MGIGIMIGRDLLARLKRKPLGKPNYWHFPIWYITLAMHLDDATMKGGRYGLR